MSTSVHGCDYDVHTYESVMQWLEICLFLPSLFMDFVTEIGILQFHSEGVHALVNFNLVLKKSVHQ